MKTIDHIDPQKRKETYDKLLNQGITTPVSNVTQSPEERLSHYYVGRAMDFLRQYGKYYHLFDYFLPPSPQYRPPINNKTSSSFINRDRHSTIRYDVPSKFYDDARSEVLMQHSPHFSISKHVYDSPSTPAVYPDIPKYLWHGGSSLQDNGHTIRDFGHYAKWNVAQVKGDSAHKKVHYNYTTTDINKKFLVNEDTNEYNNRFRYGPGINDRFLAIGFDRDPWEDSHSHGTSGGNVDDANNHHSNVYIYFIGVENDFPSSAESKISPAHDIFTCIFTYPLQAESPMEIDSHLLSAVGSPTKNNRMRCRIPEEILQHLRESAATHSGSKSGSGSKNNDQHSHGPESVIHHIDFDLIHTYYVNRTITIQNSNKMKYYKRREYHEKDMLLKNIVLYRNHPLDYRNFPFTIQTMIEDVNDPLVVEWIIYHILLGIEHFYFYVNHETFMTSTWQLEHCLIKPFLESNIVTLIYFPFYHTEHFNKIQYAALNAHVYLFGKRSNNWVSYIDVDEFFVPANILLDQYWGTSTSTHDGNSKTIRRLDESENTVASGDIDNNDMSKPPSPHPSQSPSIPPTRSTTLPPPNFPFSSLIDFVVRKLAPDPRNPAIMFDTLEMDCELSVPENYYHGGNNLLPFTDLYSSITRKKARSSSSDSVSTPERFSMSLYCTRSGYLCEEMKVGHGKMFIKPHQLENHLASPHRLNHYWVVWTKPETGGTFRHFNRFRHTHDAISQGLFSAKHISHDNSLRLLTLKMLKELVGVTIDDEQ